MTLLILAAIGAAVGSSSSSSRRSNLASNLPPAGSPWFFFQGHRERPYARAVLPSASRRDFVSKIWRGVHTDKEHNIILPTRYNIVTHPSGPICKGQSDINMNTKRCRHSRQDSEVYDTYILIAYCLVAVGTLLIVRSGPAIPYITTCHELDPIFQGTESPIAKGRYDGMQSRGRQDGTRAVWRARKFSGNLRGVSRVGDRVPFKGPISRDPQPLIERYAHYKGSSPL